MTFLAETFGSKNAICLGIGMTVDAVFQTEIGSADAFSNGLIAMMQQELKMLVTHNAFVTDALVTAGNNLAVRAQGPGFGIFIAVSKQASRYQEAYRDYGKR